MSFRSFFACAFLVVSSFSSLLIPSSIAEMARTVPALKAALQGEKDQREERKKERKTYCWTPGAALRRPALSRRSLTSRTIVAEAERHLLVLMLVDGSDE
jgi:hypothetical protein